MEHDQLAKARHSMSHIMAHAVLELFPEAKIAIGPAIENGFYYDFELPRPLKDEDLGEIEARMRKAINKGLPFTREVVTRAQALERFADQPYKTEIIDDLPESEELSLYTVGEFTDLCRGPHVESAKELAADGFKLLSIAGAYWRGDENRPMLQRIYGTAWPSKADLKAYLDHLAEIEKRDHRRLGKELDLFSTHEEAGPGLIYWHPNGARIRVEIEDFWRKEHYANGYELLYTPHVGKSWLWETSGHLDFYKEGMYPKMEMDGTDYFAKPMNCPFHILIYKSNLHSYRDLPLRWGELGTVYRYERSGTLHGLLRVRGFTQDDAHIFCTPEQMPGEIAECLRFSLFMLKSFGFSDFTAYLSTKPEKDFVGEPESWYSAQDALRAAIEAQNLPYKIDEGGGAFYGPKIDLKVNDALGREWQLSTIQFDFNEPARFGMKYIDSDGKEKQPYMVHRALLGSLERFFGVLIEHYGGAFPVWLCPVQLVIIPVAPAFHDQALELRARLRSAGLRVEADTSDSRMNAKIRDAQKRKIPYMAVVGEKEFASGTVSLRVRSGEQLNDLPIDDAVSLISAKIAAKEQV